MQVSHGCSLWRHSHWKVLSYFSSGFCGSQVLDPFLLQFPALGFHITEVLEIFSLHYLRPQTGNVELFFFFFLPCPRALASPSVLSLGWSCELFTNGTIRPLFPDLLMQDTQVVRALIFVAHCLPEDFCLFK